MPSRLHSRSNFTTRAAQDDSQQLQRRWSLSQVSGQDENEPLLAAGLHRARPPSVSREKRTFGAFFSTLFTRGKSVVTGAPAPPLTRSHHGHRRARSSGADPAKPGNISTKLGTFAGVFVPTTLNVLSILMFLRFGFILGQGGVLGMMAENGHASAWSKVS
ncbi:hypothetical protein SLS58_008832 [Diplodia intermedia]|uniref:Uncharacterized protein n=1 Tax=Diplodia intermedia TaxID=856260 RepID=A0ABR3TGJ9_9PEZI